MTGGTDTPILEVTGLVKQYPGVRALRGVDFDVRRGEVHCIVGPNGAGKSTLIKCISGAVAPTEGHVLIDGAPASTGNPWAAIESGVATIYQELDLVGDLSVADNIFLGHERRRAGLLDRRGMREATTQLLRRVQHEHIDPRAFVRDLRPAAQQIVSVARALSHDVRLLIMDEPSAILDQGEVEQLFDVVRRLTAEGVGVIYISHRLDEIAQIGDRVTVLTEGATVAVGLPADTPPDVLVAHMVGRELGQLYPDRPRGGDEIVLAVSGVRRLPDVIDASFQVRAGEVVGIAGLVGSGRSELLRAIAGVDQRDAGVVELAGTALPSGRPGVAIDRGLGLAPEDRKSQALLLGWTLTKNVSLPSLHRFRPALLDVKAERAAAAKQLRQLHTVPDDGERRAGDLSGGNQQKVVLARWLLRECRVLLLDEPTRGVDVGARTEIYRIIAELAAVGVAVVVVSSELDELLGLCTRILVMREGALVAELDGETATELEILRLAMPGGMASAPAREAS